MRGIVVVAACLLLVAGATAPAQAGAAAACSGTGSGVTVVVDFSALGGGVEIGCAPGDPGSGLAALQGAGFGWTGTSQFPTFVCRIDGLPSDQRCVSTPPATAYWAYWYAERGGSWNYSSSGGANRDPEPGDVDGWAFGSGSQPGVAPPAAPAPRPPRADPPDDPPDDPPQREEQPEDPSDPDPPGGADEPDDPGRPEAEAEEPGPREPASSPAPATDPAAPAPSSRDSAGPEAAPGNPVARTSSGNPLGVVIGLGLVAVLAAAAWLVNRRRVRS